MFRIVDDQGASNHKTLPRNRFLLRRDPFRPQRAVTPKLTMIAGRQLSIGALPVWNALLDLTLAGSVKQIIVKSGYVVETTRAINFRGA